MLRFENLGKRYGDHVLFQGLQYHAGAQSVALNDDSGTGKTTLLGMLAGEIAADEGDVWIGGHSMRSAPREAMSLLTYVPDDCIGDARETGRDYLTRVAAERKVALDATVLEWAERFGLAPHLDKRFEQMSFGTRKKMCLTSAVLGETKVVIADEPGGGLDAAARSVLVDLFTSLARDRAVFFSSYDTALARACGAKPIAFADLRS